MQLENPARAESYLRMALDASRTDLEFQRTIRATLRDMKESESESD